MIIEFFHFYCEDECMDWFSVPYMTQYWDKHYVHMLIKCWRALFYTYSLFELLPFSYHFSYNVEWNKVMNQIVVWQTNLSNLLSWDQMNSWSMIWDMFRIDPRDSTADVDFAICRDARNLTCRQVASLVTVNWRKSSWCSKLWTMFV